MGIIPRWRRAASRARHTARLKLSTLGMWAPGIGTLSNTFLIKPIVPSKGRSTAASLTSLLTMALSKLDPVGG